MKNVLVLGGSGFIGSAVVKKLLEMGCNVRMLVHRRPVFNNTLNVSQISGDIRQFPWISLNNDLPDTIFHLARISGYGRPGRFLSGIQGYMANKRMVRWLESLQQPPRLIFASGSLVYGSRGNTPVYEDTPMDPISFQRSYVLGELPFLNALKNKKLPISIIRPPWVYGPDSWFRQFYMDVMIKEDVVPQYGEGNNLMSLIHIKDCASQIIDVAKDNSHGNIINLVSAPAITHEEFCRLLSEVSGKKVRKITDREIKFQYGKTVYEALTFSSDMRSRHLVIRRFQCEYDLPGGLKELWGGIGRIK